MLRKTKEVLLVIGGIILLICLVLVGLFAFNTINKVSASHTVIRPEKGIVCVQAITFRSVALSCIQDYKNEN